MGCALAARVRISAIIALSVRPSACAISRNLRSTSGATTLRTITTRSVRGERAGNVRAMDLEAPLPLRLRSTVLVIATPHDNISGNKTTDDYTSLYQGSNEKTDFASIPNTTLLLFICMALALVVAS